MSKIVLIQANPPPGFNFHGEAHRLWPASTPVKVEILDQEDDPPEVPVKRRRGEEEVIDLAPDPHRIGKRSFRALQANTRIRILSDSDSIVNAETSAAKQQIEKLQAENTFLRSEVANFETENDQLKARVLELERAAGIAPTPLPRSTADQGVVPTVPGEGDEGEVGPEGAAGPTGPDAKGKDKKDKKDKK